MSTEAQAKRRDAILTNGCNNNRVVDAAFSIRLAVSVSVLQDVIITCQVMVFSGSDTAVVSWIHD